ncbi:MAG: hypothetical protein RMK98_07345 [Bacteroidia bacterium]|nr:hypothetical protein [Bacteroidia bacterium]
MADSLQKHFSARYPLLWINLHRHPQLGSAIQHFPAQWRGILHYTHLSLHAAKEQAVFSESNKIRTESTYRLTFQVEGVYIMPQARLAFSYRGELPPSGWKTSLLRQLLQQAESLLKN